MFLRPLIALAAAFLVFGQAAAEPKLVTSTPAAGSSAAKVSRIELRFSEPLAGAPAIDLTMTAMPGMSHHDPMKIAGFKTDLGADRKTVSIALPRALPAGTYRLGWKAGASRSEVVFSAR